MPKPTQVVFDFKHVPTLWRFHNDPNPVKFIVGPVGSGKTTFLCSKIMTHALEQEPGRDETRWTKWAWVRNTMPELKRTTIDTWTSVFPEQSCGNLRWSSPVRHHVRKRPTSNEPGLDCIVEFMALDRPRDVRELLSWNGTGIIFNEVREIPKAIIDAADLRVGRYPSEKFGGVDPTWFGIMGDTNPPDEDHWIARADAGIDENGIFVGRPEGWSIYHQPPGVIEVRPCDGGFISVDKEFPDLGTDNPDHVVYTGGKHWMTNPDAENLPNLPVNKALDPSEDPLGRGGYYVRGLHNKAADYVRGYLQGRYGYIREGKPVVPEFAPNVHVVDELPPIPDGTLIDVGADVGGNTLNPAAVFGTLGPRGVWLIYGEVVASSMGLDNFVTGLLQGFTGVFGNPQMMGDVCADPAGRTKDGIFETVAFDHMIMRGLNVLPAPTNDTGVRIDATRAPFNRMIDGKPAILIHRRCVNLIKALSGAWCYRRLQISGSERYTEVPDKTHPYSDVADALGYLLSTKGETMMVARGTPLGSEVQSDPISAPTDFDVFAS